MPKLPRPRVPMPRVPRLSRPHVSRPRLVVTWSQHRVAAAAGAAGLIAATAAVALVATGAGAGAAHPRPSATVSDAGYSTRSGLDAIFALHPDLGRPVSAVAADQHLPAASYAGDQSRIGVPKNVKPAPRPSGTQGSGSAPAYIPGPASGDLTPLQLATLALRAGCSAAQASTAAAIAAAESGGNPAAQGDITLMTSTWDWSEGLWQIRGLRAERGTGGLRDSMANGDPLTNAAAMYVISGGCTNWAPWSTFTNGAYAAYLPIMRSAVDAAVGYQVKFGAYPPVTVTPGPARVPAPQPKPAPRHRRTHGHQPRRHHHGRRHGPRGPSSSPAAPRPTPSRTSTSPSHHPRPRHSHSSSPNGLPSLPTSGLPTLPTSGLPTLPTSGLPSLPTSGLPTLPSLP